MQNLTPERATEFSAKIEVLRKDVNLSERSKLLRLGLYSMSYFGEKVVQSAIVSLGPEIVIEAARSAEGSTNIAQRAATTMRRVTQGSRESAKTVAEIATATPGTPEAVQNAANANAEKAVEADKVAEDLKHKVEVAAADAEHVREVAESVGSEPRPGTPATSQRPA